MKEDAFRLWLLNHHCNADGGSIDIRTISSRLSNCRTVERYEGDLDLQFDQDQLRSLLEERQSGNALVLDDNDYPKQIWSFVFRGAQFSKFGPSGYALAHLADHKEHGNRYKTDFEVTAAEKSTPPLFGLYTCLSNTVYTPLSLIKPKDFVGTIRSLLIRRAQQLYGEVCQILPSFLRVPDAPSTEWNVNKFKWADPVGTTQHMQSFLVFRRDRIQKLIDMKPPNRD